MDELPDYSAEQADYIVVGAGSAGCVVADRLSETGDIMINCADKFQNGDESKILDVVNTFDKATGTWGES